MKYLVMLCDGMADYPVVQFGGKTPLMMAKAPFMQSLAQKAEVGVVKTVPDGMKPGSDVANLAVLGYDPAACYTGRSPLEAGSIGIDMADDDVSLRCNLVTVTDEPDYADKTIVDYCAGDISTEDAAVLVKYLAEHFNNEEFALYNGVSYRHCLIWHKGTLDLGKITAPHDITGKPVREYLPTHPNAAKLYAMMQKSYELLKDHPLNKERMAKGLRPANSVWFWGEGKRAQLENFYEKYGVHGAMISAVDLLKGIGKFADMQVIQVEGATGYLDTNFEGKANAAIEAFRGGADLVYIHVEAPDECGHRNEPENKVRSIELIDQKVLQPVCSALAEMGAYRVLVTPDHPTPLCLMTHTNDAVPFFIYDSEKAQEGVAEFNEETAKQTGLLVAPGYTIMQRLLSR
ncbi:MAG: cofactor-independent phosphoglycerate mutase [Oscillospiraceae bacterium]|nr:cofactor-independent phosphoglycerate mutase [Oscillospiraceae bacterium]